MTELKPCPFCGNEAAVDEENLVGSGVSFFVGCNNTEECGCQITMPFAMRRDAVTAWNYRAAASEREGEDG